MDIKKIKQIIIQKKNLYRVLSFVISVLLIILIFLINKMNGKEYLVMRSDYVESIGLLKEATRCFFSHDSIYFNNSTGLGLNNIITVSGLFSPFNLLFILFNGLSYDFITALVIILKVGLASLSFQIFSDKILKNNNFSSVIISVFYSLNAYIIVYGTINNCWIDALIILPLLCASIITCIETGKRLNVILLYTYLFINNYYIGYMVGIFSFLFILSYLLIVYEVKSSHIIKERLIKFVNWILAVLVAVMLSAFVWVPTLFFIASYRVPDSTEVVKLNVSLLQILNSLFWGNSYGIEGTYSYIYCGIPILILVPLFFLNKKIEKKLKLFYGFLISIILLSMVSNQLNTIWHVFDQPDDFWYRYSFCVCFCLCTVASIEINHFDLEENRKLFPLILGLIFFYQIMLHTISLWTLELGVLNTNYGFIVNLIFMILWCLILFMVFSKQRFKILCAILAIAIMSFELASNSKRILTDQISAEPYYIWNCSVEKTVSEIKNNDNSFYRMIIAENNNLYNADMFFGYKGIGDFGNQEKYAVRRFLSNIGFGTSPRVTCENGFNPVANMLLGIKYELYAPEIDFKPGVVSLTEDEENENETLKQEVTTEYSVSNNSLSLGYMSGGDLIFYEYSGRNVFDNMNEIVTYMTGLEKNCYIPFSKDDMILDSNNISLTEMDSGDMVFERVGDIGDLKISIPQGDYKEAYIQFEEEEPGIFGTDYYVIDSKNQPSIICNRLGVSSAIKMNLNEEDNKFEITIGSYDGYSPELFVCDNINIYYLDEEALQDQYNELSKNQLLIKNFSNGHVDGTIHVEGDKRLLFTTIPYDLGWKAYVNGQEVETIRVIDGAFLGVFLPTEGDYNITFEFECPGLKIGIIVSICGILAFASVVFEKKIKKKTDKV